MTNNTLHRDKTALLAASLPIVVVLLLVPALAEAHGKESFFLPFGQLLALVPVTIIAWRLTRGIRARVVVIFCALVAPVLLWFLPNHYMPWWLLASEISSFLTGFIASTIVATLVALLWRGLLQRPPWHLATRSAAVRSHQGMRIEDTEREFKRLVRQRGYDVTTLHPAEAVAVVLDFYRSVRSPEVDPCDGDALLSQWGTFDWGEGKHFEFDLTRQLIRNGGTEDSDINQLHVTFSFPPTPDLSVLGQSNRWCWSVADCEVFESFIRESAAFKAVSSLSPSSVSVRFEEV